MPSKSETFSHPSTQWDEDSSSCISHFHKIDSNTLWLRGLSEQRQLCTIFTAFSICISINWVPIGKKKFQLSIGILKLVTQWPESGDEGHQRNGEDSKCSVVDSGHLTRSST